MKQSTLPKRILLCAALAVVTGCQLQPRPGEVDRAREPHSADSHSAEKSESREEQPKKSTHVISSEEGIASFYGKEDGFNGRLTANGETFDKNHLTAAHRVLPFNSKVRVTNLKNKKSITVRINDRGPAIKDRIIDLSYAAAKELGFVQDGLIQVRVEWLE